MAIRKREWTTKNDELRSAWICDYVDGSGKRRLRTFARKRDAEAFRATATVEVGEGVHTPRSATVTVAKACDLWFASAADAGLERATQTGYEAIARLHVWPFLGRLKLSAVSVPVVRAFETQLRNAGRSAAMTGKIIAALHGILSDAQERGLVAQNAVSAMRAGRRRGRDKRHEDRRRRLLQVGVDVPSRTEMASILAAARPRYAALLHAAALTGLRASELRGLSWVDVDLATAEVTVRQRADRFSTIGAPKSASARRTLPLPPSLCAMLRARQLATGGRGEALVFSSSSGRPIDLGSIIKLAWKPAQVAAGVTAPVLDGDGGAVLDGDGKAAVRAKYPGLHAIRHFHASWLAAPREAGGLGLTLQEVQARLGHADLATTAGRYLHLFPRPDHGARLAEGEKALLG